MDTLALLTELRARQVELRLDGDKLVVQAPKGAVDAPLAEAIRAQKPALMALLREAQGQRAQQEPIPRLGRDRARLALPQERLWLAQRLDPASAVYNLPGAWRLRGDPAGQGVDPEVMRRTLAWFVERHDLLRSVFREEGGEARVIFEPGRELVFAAVDVSGEADPERALHAFLDQEAARPFDLENEPAARFWLITVGPADHVVYVVTHAVIWDGWSFDLFLNDLSAGYQYFAAATPDGAGPPVAPVPLRFGDYAEWQRARAETPAIKAQLDAWRQILRAPLPRLELPTDRPAAGLAGHRGARAYLRFPETVVSPLAALARAESTTLYVVLLTAWETLLYRYSGETDLIVTTPVRGRERPELEHGVGIYTNTLFFRTDLAAVATFREAIRRTKGSVLRAFENQDAPVDALLGELASSQDLGRSALFQAMFSYQNTNNRVTHVGPCSLAFVPQAIHAVYADVNFWVKDAHGKLLGAVDYRTELFDHGTVERLIGHLEAVLVEAGRDPDRSLESLPIRLPADETVLVGLEGAAARRADDSLSHAAEYGFAHPDALALTGDGFSLTFRELEAAIAARAGRYLDAGVLPRRPVAVQVARTPDALVDVFAALRLGATAVLGPSGGAGQYAAPQLPTDAALIDLSAGSSLSPEPVTVTPAALRFATHAVSERLGLGPRDVLLSGSRGVGLLVECMAALGRGATVVLPNAAVLSDSWELRDLVESRPITAVVGEYGLLRALADEGLLPARAVVRDGPFEGAIWLDGPRATAGVLAEHVGAGLWRPLRGAKIEIVDGRGERVPVGVRGAVRVTVPGEKPCVTEVRSRWRAEHLERLADAPGVVRNLGVAVHLEEVARVLRQQAGVRDAHVDVLPSGPPPERAAMGRDDAQSAPTERRLEVTAWLVADDTAPGAAALRDALLRLLPAEAVPAVFVRVAQLRRAGGEVDRRSLPNPLEREGGGALPATDAEQALAEVWSGLLGRGGLRTCDNFFELGGTSLLALRAVVEVERRLGARSDPRLYFYQSLGELAKALA